MSNIEWTGKTVNPLIGCTKKSAGCEHCYAIKEAWIHSHHPNETFRKRYDGTVHETAGGKLNWTGKINYDIDIFARVLKNKKPTMYFPNSMSDIFHESLSIDIIAEIYAIMFLAHWHTFQVLTKRADKMHAVLTSEEFKLKLWAACNRMHHLYIKPLEQPLYFDVEVFQELPLKNVWQIVSVEDQKTLDERLPHLLKTPAAVRGLSCEPLLGSITFRPKADTMEQMMQLMDEGVASKPIMLSGIDWVICGGESGSNSTPMHPDWARYLRDQCNTMGVAFFFKQWGEYWPGEQGRIYRAKTIDFTDGQPMVRTGKKKAGRVLDGRLWDEMPKAL